MSRKELPTGEKKKQIPIHIKEKITYSLGKNKVQEIAENAVNKEYLKTKKNGIV